MQKNKEYGKKFRVHILSVYKMQWIYFDELMNITTDDFIFKKNNKIYYLNRKDNLILKVQLFLKPYNKYITILDNRVTYGKFGEIKL